MLANVASLGGKPSNTFFRETTKHLLLKDEISHYFFNDCDAQACTYTWNPFAAKPDDLPVGFGEQEELIYLQCNEDAQEKFKDFTLANFWLNVSSSYSTLAKNCNCSASSISNKMGMRTRVFYISYKQVEN